MKMQLFKFKENQMAKKLTRAEKIRRYIRENPTAKTVDVAAHFETRYQNVYAVRRKMDTPMIAKAKVDLTPALKFLQGRAQAVREKGQWENIGVFSSDKSIAQQIEMFEPKSDPINHPAHYKIGGIETIDFIEAKSLDYNLGNVVKYITRADHKGNKLEDLRKAQWYLTRAIETAK
jgi:hypothetical protein